MPSPKLLLKTAIACIAIACASCNAGWTATGCSEFARTILTTPTPHAEVGETGDAALDAQNYGLAETGQLNKANDDKSTGFSIIQTCEQRDEEIRRQQRRWLPF